MGKLININKFVDRPQRPRTLLRKDLSKIENHSAEILNFPDCSNKGKESFFLSERSTQIFEQFVIDQQRGIAKMPPFV